MAEWSEACPVDRLIAGSNPFKVFLIFHQFLQTLRACSSFAQKIANMGPFPLTTRGSGLPLQAVKVRGVSRHLYEILV